MPRAVLVRPTDCAANRKVVATRLITLQVRVSSTLRPLILLRGQRPSQAQQALALRHLLMSTPISETMSITLKAPSGRSSCPSTAHDCSAGQSRPFSSHQDPGRLPLGLAQKNQSAPDPGPLPAQFYRTES